RSIVFWSLPATALFIVLRAQVVRVVLGAGEFGWADTRLTAAALALFAVSLVAQALALLLLRAHYASGRTARPLVASALAAVTTAAVGVLLLALFRTHPPFAFFVEALLRVTDVPGTAALALPLAFSLGAFLHAGLLWALLAESARGLWRSVSGTLFESFAAATLAGAAAYGGLQLFDNFLNLQKTAGVFLHGFLAGLLGIAAWAVVLYALKNRDLADMWATVHQKIWRSRPISPDPADNPTL
ncbi:MAG: lipid II flippase MurJ, partial [Rubrivivax sp.]